MKILMLTSLYLLSIAQQCPLEGGNAVFKARALYALVEDVDYDDDILCGNQALMQSPSSNDMESISENKKMEVKSMATFQVYPNPVKSILTVEYTLAKTGTLIIYDIYGREILQEILSSGNTHIQINTQNITNGLYLLKVFDEEGERFTSKIIIQH